MSDNFMLKQDVDRIHTTPMGADRIRRNLGLDDTVDVVDYCKQVILQSAVIERKGKNWYANTGEELVTINAGSLTIITAHKVKRIN
ncbi:MAG: DUF3781 domain-containing protein [Firmicutes bacterium]|nr:DUF3781 domain-containing protein [Bacillota bacterium]